jgi:hypothetical protein
MKHNYLLSSYNSTMRKYQKYFSRLQRNIKSGNFLKLSAGRKNFLLRKVEELRAKLASMQPRLAGTVAAAGLLLALSAPQAEAQFSLNQATNPFAGSANTSLVPFASNYSSVSNPIFVDVDGDGDKDVVVGSGNGGEYFKNTGTASAPVYTSHTCTNNPFDNLVLPTLATYYGRAEMMSMADLDNDGDLDLIVAFHDHTEQIYYFKNTGTITSPVFTLQTGTDNPIPVITVNSNTHYILASFVDIDADGDQDIFVGFGTNYGVNTAFFKNTGTASAPAFAEQTGTNNPLATGIGYSYGIVFPSFVDIDGDGDMDAVLSNYSNSFSYYKNTGTASAAVFSLQTGTKSPFSAFSLNTSYLNSSFADLDGDGDQDMIVGNYSGVVSYYKNTGTATAPAFDFSPGVTGSYIRPAFADIDGDGDKDAVFGSQNGGLLYFKNNGPASAPVYVNVTGTYSPLNVTSGYTFTAPAFSDIDGDGDLDLMLGSRYGIFTYYQNTGNSTAPVYTMQTGTNNPMNAQSTVNFSTPVFVDLDNDGDKDLVSGSYTGGMYYFMNTGTVSAPVFTMQTGTNNPVEITSSYTLWTPTFVNFDGDADMDMVVGTYLGGMLYFANTGTSSAPVFTAKTGTNNPFAAITNNGVAPAFDDIDGDTDLDLFVGLGAGTVTLYENTTLNLPTVGASNLGFTSVTTTSFTINWTNGDGSDRLVLIKQGSAVDQNPANATGYSASAGYGSGSELGTGNYAVYNGTGNSVTVTGLTPNTIYYVKIYEFDGTGSTTEYDISDGLTGSQTTNAVSAGLASSPVFRGTLAAYPNPVKDVLNFSLKDGIGSSMKVSVLNMAGSEILSQNFDNNGSVMSINVSELDNGMYMLRLSSDSKVSVVKFVKQ